MDKHHYGKVKIYGRLRSVFFTLFPRDKRRKFRSCPVEKKIRKWITELPDTMKYYRLVKHQCPTTIKEHYHGFINFKKRYTWGAIKKMFCSWIHIEKPKNETWCINYCEKEGSIIEGPWETGTRNRPGFRSDLTGSANKIAEEIQQGNTLEDIKNEHPGFYMMNKAKIQQQWCEDNVPDRVEDKKIIIMFGKTGSGKTYQARNYSNNWMEIGAPRGDGKIWMGKYKGQDTIIINEMGKGKAICYEEFKKLTDEWSYEAPVKCQMDTKVCAKTIITTSCINPKYWYPGVSNKKELLRRFKKFGEIWWCQGSDGTHRKKEPFTVKKYSMKSFKFVDEHNFST